MISVFEKAVQLLKDDFGAILSSSAEYGFNFTDYYKEEFGTDLKKMLTYLTTLNFLKYLCSCLALGEYADFKLMVMKLDNGK